MTNEQEDKIIRQAQDILEMRAAVEKEYFLTVELEPTTIYIICIANILVAGYLTYKGIKILLTHK